MYYNSQSIYDAAGGGRYTNVKTAFDVGYEAATGGKGSDNPTRSCLLYTSPSPRDS